MEHFVLTTLVITIIVLLILAGVTVATLTGENGLLSKTQLAKERTAEGEQDEKDKLSSYETELDNYSVSTAESRASAAEINSIAQALNSIGVSTSQNENIESLCEKIRNIEIKAITKYTLNGSSTNYGSTYEFDISNYENYGNLTIENISVELYKSPFRDTQQSDACGRLEYTYSYNASNGKITVTLGGSVNHQSWSEPSPRAQITIID